jgi:hypothetical protein
LAAVIGLGMVIAGGALAADARRHHRKPRVFVNGDSLAVGTRPYLPRDLRRYRVTQSTSISRHAPEGVDIMRGFSHFPRAVVMSLGTNDDPRAVDEFRSAVRTTIHLAGRHHCVVWPNIVRPPVAGAGYAGYNHVLAVQNREHRNMRVVKWTRMVKRHPSWIGSDGVHPNADGYASRAAVIAREVRRCVKGIQ